MHIHIHMHITIDTAIHNKTARVFKEKGLLVEEEILVEPGTGTDRGLADFGSMARYGANGGDGGNGGNSGHDGNDGHARAGDSGTDGRAGIAGTICILVNPDIVIPSNVPISYVMSRPNWNNAIINPLEHLK